MIEMVVITGAIRCAKLQSECHHQQTNTQFLLQAGHPSCHPTNSAKVLKEKEGSLLTARLSHIFQQRSKFSYQAPNVTLIVTWFFIIFFGSPCLFRKTNNEYITTSLGQNNGNIK